MSRDVVVEFVLATGLILGVAGCDRPGVETQPPNILLISIDALRADHLSSYGYDRRTSPVIDELASRGIRFSKAFVNTHGTPPSHTTLLSSLYQETHQVDLEGSHEHPNDHRIPDEVELVQEILQSEGWHTVAVTGGGCMSAEFGSQLYCIRTPRWKLIWRPAVDRAQLFDLRHDPLERRKLVQRKPKKSAQLLAELEAWRRARRRLDLVKRPPHDLSTDKLEELQALGYSQ